MFASRNLLAIGEVVSLHVGILSRPTGRDEFQADVIGFGPLGQVDAYELRAIVVVQLFRVAASFNQSIDYTGNPLGRKTQVNLNGRGPGVVVIEDVERPESMPFSSVSLMKSMDLD